MMVGPECAKLFPKSKSSDRIRDLAKRRAPQPPRALLAKTWTDQDPTGWHFSEKLDGVRAIWDGKRLISRLGNEFHAPAFFRNALPANEKLDGELFVGRGLFPETVSIVKSHEDKGWSKIKYRVFDFYAPPGNAHSATPFEQRQAKLKIVVRRAKSKHLQHVKQTRCKGPAHLKKAMDQYVKAGAEGLMLREPGSHYVGRRSGTLLKVKRFHDTEGKVVGYEPGKGRLKGLMGALIVERNGKRFNVGTGFTDEQRRHPPKPGTKITFRYQEMTERGVPRFPSFVAARNYE
jgi:DNA ligase-1